MRHGEAGYSASSDSSRPLTAYGKEQCASVAKWFNQQQITLDLGWVSPYLRAQQSFSIINDSVTVGHIETNNILTPSGSATQIVDSLAILPLTGVNSVLIVSHLPLVGYLVNELCPEVQPIMFSTADVACVSLSSDGKGVLEWVHHPI